jgi:hypothetical protein
MSRENELRNLFNDNQKIKFGCVMFDLVENSEGKLTPNPGSGWASIEGGSSYRIKNTSDLSNEVTWITNLSQEVFWKTSAVKQKKLKFSGYLRTDIGQIMKELGLTPPKVPIVKVCETISDIFNRVMRLAIEFYGITGFIHKDLYSEIRSTLFADDTNVSTPVDEALSRSYQDLVICERPIIKERVNFITLKRPRYFHAKSILDTSIPVWNGDWEFLSSEDMPKNASDKIKFLMSKEKPFIVKIVIHSFNHQENINLDLGKLLNLGEAIGEGGKPKPRNWVCQPELLYLSKFADIDVEAAFVASGYQELEKSVQLPYLGELSDFSYSLGILSECVWIGLASRSINPKNKSKTLVSPRACWLKAADRFMTLTSAMMLASAGFIVVSYGYGGVTVMVEDYKIPQLIELAPHAGLSVPINIIEKRIVTF